MAALPEEDAVCHARPRGHRRPETAFLQPLARVWYRPAGRVNSPG